MLLCNVFNRHILLYAWLKIMFALCEWDHLEWIFYWIFWISEIYQVWTKYLDNSRPCTKQVKKTVKQLNKFVADVGKIIFSLAFNIIESYHPEHLLVYYNFLKTLYLWRMYSTSGICLLQDPPPPPPVLLRMRIVRHTDVISENHR